MKSREKFLNAVTYVGLTVLTIGILAFIAGIFVTGYNILVPIGIGTSVGAVFIFLIGVFLVVTDEMLERSYIGTKVVPIKSKKGAPIQ
jgi:ABC-type multidrug transport system permease subunit